MHICFVNMPIEYYSPVSGGAISTIIMENARELIKRGHRVTVLTKPGEDEQYAIGDLVPVEAKQKGDLSLLQRAIAKFSERRNGYDWPYFEFYLRSVKDRLNDLQPDAVILFNDLVSPGHLRPVLRKARLLVWLQNEWRTRNTDLGRTVAATDVFMTCSRYISEWTAETHRIPAGKFAVAASGVDAAAFHPRADFLESRQPVKALFIGRIDPNKGPDIAVDAVCHMRQEGLDVEMTVAGGLWFYGHGREMEDPFFRELHGKMEAAGAKYVGHITRSRLPELIRGHDIAFVMSRSNEPFGLVVLESMASGLAVIASNRGGLPEASGGAARLVDPDDFEAVAANLRELVVAPERLRDCKQASTAWAHENGWSRCADSIEQAIGRSHRSF